MMFSSMSDFRLGKSSTLFSNIAKELGHMVLTNKKEQTTRFVGSVARGMKTFLQNLPTIVNVLGTVYDQHVMEEENTKAKEVLSKLQKLRDPRFLARLVGLGQIFELYCEVSLEGQFSNHLPSQVWNRVNQNRELVRELSENWMWGEKDLKFVEIEAPRKIIDRLQKEGIYRPNIFLKNVMRKGRELKEAGLLDEGNSVSSLFEDNVMVKALAGEISVEVPAARRTRGDGDCDGHLRNIDEGDIKVVEKELQALCKSIVEEWDIRMVQSPLAEATCEVLGKAIRIDDQDEFASKLVSNLEKLVAQLPSNLQEKFSVTELLGGYSTYMTAVLRLERTHETHEIYELWYTKYVNISEPEESSCIFADFFECVQVRSSSEAFCETVGSVMNNHSGKGRYLRPVNFNKEIFLEVNLGPTYLSEQLVREVYELRKKDYIYSEDAEGRLLHGGRLVDEQYGSSLKTFRRSQREKS